MRRHGLGESWDELIARIYDVALGAEEWPSVIAHASDLLGAGAAQCFIADWSKEEVSISPVVSHRLDPESAAHWLEHYIDQDLWTSALGPRIASSVATGASAVDRSDLRRSEIYGVLLGPNRIEDLLCTVLADESGVHTVLSFYARDLFQRRQVELLERLRPHLLKAARLQQQLAPLEAHGDMRSAALDALTIGVLILDAAGRLVHANRRAESILNGRDGLGVCDRRLRCQRRTETADLDAAIHRALEGALGLASANASVLAISRPSLRRPLCVLVSPIPQRSREALPLVAEDMGGRAAVLLTITDPEERVQLPVERLVTLFGLTASEARLAAALASRETVDEYAEQARITRGTARWTVKRVLDKTGCRRQSELVHLLATSVAAFVPR